MREHYDMVRAVCHRIVLNPSDADDATQIALMSIVRALPSFDRRSKFSTWAYRIATNAALDEIRRIRRRPFPTQDTVVYDTPSRDATEAVDAQLDVSEALAQLSEEYRTVIVLRHVVDMEYDEIAIALDVPIGTVRSRLARGRSQLAEILGNSSDPTQRQKDGNEKKGNNQ